MADDAGRSAGAPYACASCSQSLFGVVRHCPFCGARQVEQASSAAAPAPSRSDAGSKLQRGPGPQPEEAMPLELVDRPPAEKERAAEPRAVAPSPAPQAAPKAKPQPEPPAAKPAEAPTVPVQPARPIAAPAVAAEPSPPTPPAPPKPGGGFAKFVGLLLVAGAGYAGWATFLKPKLPDSCQQALEAAASSMQANQFAEAKAQALGAVAHCAGDSQDRAKTILKVATDAHAADEGCSKAVGQADGQIADGRLKLAQRTLGAQPSACLGRQDAAELKLRLDANMTGAAEKLTLAQNQLAAAQPDLARTSVDEAERLDRDNADIAKVRKEIALWRPAESPPPPPQAAPDPPVAVTPAPLPRPVLAPTQGPRGDAADSSKLVECAVLVRAGQRALANNSYDEAMHSAQEARAAVPNCPGAAELFQGARQAKDKARQSVVIQ